MAPELDLRASCPSTLTYKDRLALKEVDSIAYSRLYSTGATSPVWDRLSADATMRSSRALKPTPPSSLFPTEAAGSFAAVETLSGYVTNTSPKSWDESLTFRTGHLDYEGTAWHRHPKVVGQTRRPHTTPMATRSCRVDTESLHPIVLKRFAHRQPMEYYSSIRPDTMTTNQTLRMMGTYDVDYAAADRSGAFIPSFCPGGPAWFHPDVALTSAPTVHRTRKF